MTRERPTIRRQESRARKPSNPRRRKSNRETEHLEAAQVSVGNFLRATRESLHLTQADVAQQTHASAWRLSRAAVSAIERGQNFPGLEAMLALSNVLHIDPKELIERARLTAVVPVDITGLTDEELESRASQYFWAGDFRQALSVYDAMVEKLALEAPERREIVSRLATLEVRRATTLKRIGALISAIASIERAISLSSKLPALQTEAYVVLSGLQAQRGHLPLALDAAERAIALARESNPTRLGWAHMVKGKALFLGEQYRAAKESFLEARRLTEAGHDRQHLAHIALDIGSSCLAMGERAEARRALDQAVAFAREHRQPAVEANALVQLGKVELAEGRPEEAEARAGEALKIAKPLEHALTIFCAEWLRYRIEQHVDPGSAQTARLGRLHQLFLRLDEHSGVEEIVEYRQRMRTAHG